MLANATPHGPHAWPLFYEAVGGYDFDFFFQDFGTDVGSIFSGNQIGPGSGAVKNKRLMAYPLAGSVQAETVMCAG
jgi:hypothetical protein